MWTLSVTSSALAELYQLQRGDAAEVTDAIGGLRLDPTPANCEQVVGMTDVYRIRAAEHLIEYQVLQSERIIKILSIR